MINSTVTCIVNGKTYRLCADDTKEMRNMSSIDRQQLIDLLEVLKQQHSPVKPVVQPVVQSNIVQSNVVQDVAPNIAQKNTDKEHVSEANLSAQSLGSGDVNALAARLLEEEKSKQKPPISKGAVYKWVGGITVVAMLLILIL